MRELKFRAWNHTSEIMFYDVCLDKYGNASDGVSFLTYDKDKDAVMQFTGLKDQCGNDIYEGDIIEYIQHHFNTDMVKIKRKVVEWKHDRWSIYETRAGESDIKVIGNIFQQAHLI
jgi:uncharacterized phage protein (TIGR01671 family)